MSLYRTYKQVNGTMVHDGYFLLVENIPLKWISLEQFNNLDNAVTRG